MASSMFVEMAGLWAAGPQQTMDAMWAGFLQVLPIWIFGALVGLLLPRPNLKWRAPVLLPATALRNVAIAAHAFILLRELWTHATHRGTFRGLARATVSWLCGNGFCFQWPAQHQAVGAKAVVAEASSSERIDNWYVGEKDLAFFKYHAVDGGPCDGASPWQLMMDKDVPGLVRYTSWRRTLPCGKAEYKSVTISPNATAREFSDLYLDDDFRRNWDGMVYHHEVLEHGDFAQRQQVVRWIRRFPFAFLSDREYTIARREFREADGSIYGITRALAGHPREVECSQVRMDVFWSMWRSRTVADPWGGAAPACETVLLHHEQFKIPENLARFAVKHGMWGFVKKLASTVPLYVEARRKRGVAPDADDPEAYGFGELPNPPAGAAGALRHSDSVLSLDGSSSSSGYAASECGSEDSARGASGHAPGQQGQAAARRRARRARGVATVVLAGGLALALGARGGGCQPLSGGGRAQRRHVSSHRLAGVPEVLLEEGDE